MREIHVFPTVESLPADLPGRWQAVAVDTLRATTTIVAALAAGAAAVVPVASPEEALAARFRGGGAVLAAGEREGRAPAGFDLGNSPREFVPDRVGGRRIYLTTTNGTRALLTAAAHGDVLCAAFRNAGAVARVLRAGRGGVLILCAGTEGRIAAEDLAVAGAVIVALRPEADADGWRLHDLARVARAWYEAQCFDLAGALAATDHGQFLARSGLQADLAECARQDACDVVPVFHGGAITALGA